MRYFRAAHLQKIADAWYRCRQYIASWDMKPVDDFEFALKKCQAAARKQKLAEVGRATGLDYSWLTKFTRGSIPGASYKRVRLLADHFKNGKAA